MMHRTTSPRRNRWVLRAAALFSATALTAGIGVGATMITTTETAAAATAYANMPAVSEGSTGQTVRGLQNLLTAHGISTDVDGIYGPATVASVRSYQEANGLGVDGSVGPETWGSLLGHAASGDTGDRVEGIQRILNDNGHSLEVDGSFGPATEGAVRDFQSSTGIAVDGSVGPETWNALLTRTANNGGGDDPEGKDYDNPKTSGYENGNLPEEVLCTVPFSTADKVACYIVDDLVALNDDYRAHFGEDIKITDPGDGNAYRPLSVQQKYWDWWGSPRAAVPGTSNHGWGLAIDVPNSGGHGGAVYNWLNANAGAHGFDDTVSFEAWHWEYIR